MLQALERIIAKFFEMQCEFFGIDIGESFTINAYIEYIYYIGNYRFITLVKRSGHSG